MYDTSTDGLSSTEAANNGSPSKPAAIPNPKLHKQICNTNESTKPAFRVAVANATRRKRKTDNLDGELESDEYIIRNGRKRLHAGEAPHTPIDRSIYSEAPLTPGGSIGRREPLRRPGDTSATTRDFSSGEDSNAQLANLEAQEVMRDRVYGPHDALDLLYKAATDRALHFPPTEAIDELMLPNYEATFASEAEQRQEGSFGGKRIESWLEPAWRSDRMCWMLLSTAMGLAHELGVFDDIDELLRDGSMPRPEYEDEGYRQRAYRIKRLLLIYLTQLAGRLGWKNMVPEQLWKTDPASRQHTTEIIQSGQYIELLREFQPMLYSWWKEFDRFRLPPYIRHILTIEYEYVRIYINSLSLQAVVERCTNHAANATAGNHDAPTNTEGDNAIPQLSPQTQNYYGKLPLGQLGGFTQEDQTYIREVVDGCRNLLRIVVYGLLPKGYLKHAPVRTYFRIISGAMFLLKTFALGAPRSDVKISIGLMDQAVEALRNCVVDDVHLGVRFADLLETLTSRLRTRFIQAPVMPGTTSSTTTSPSVAIAATPFDLNNFHFAATNSLLNTDNTSTPLVDPSTSHLADGPSRSASTNTTNHNAATIATAGAVPSSAASAAGSTTTSNALNAGSLGFEDWTGGEMWYLPPGPAFLQNVDSNNVQMTSEGVNVGGTDLLDYLAMDSFPPIDTNGGSGGGPAFS
ncbi:hypothetical protein CFO_g3567 [Ceratocystis platani]|uniref:Transcriptional activator ARO80 n=1 Tax=Ceratocystis fimbriata f. sp. platani TaxID=88771 RepID=A0A0F8BNH8_CERFI|nr:hypothetical protein CFO_g3567 [Ceratocystis platani]